ncbi:MAG TPA: hypothetical protein VFL72_05535 [Acidimicrobiia bacterium]|nr:hypothetical protein [Acidimicrobiia bacterium]
MADQIITFSDPEFDPVNDTVVETLNSMAPGYADVFAGYTYTRRPDGSSELRLQRAEKG